MILPAPGAPADLSWRDPRGHLNIRIAWATPPALRQLALLQTGFDIYRIDPDFFTPPITPGRPLRPVASPRIEHWGDGLPHHPPRATNTSPSSPSATSTKLEHRCPSPPSWRPSDGEVETFFLPTTTMPLSPARHTFPKTAINSTTWGRGEGPPQVSRPRFARHPHGRCAVAILPLSPKVSRRWKCFAPVGPLRGRQNDPVFSHCSGSQNDNAVLRKTSAPPDVYIVYRWRNPHRGSFSLN